MLAINSSTPPRRYIISPPFTASPDPPTLLKERGNLRMSDPEQEQSNIRRSPGISMDGWSISEELPE